MKKMQDGGNTRRKARLEKKAGKVMSRAQKTYAESLGAIEDAKKSGTKADAGGAEQLQNRALRQEARAKKLKAKASMLKTGGMVNPNKAPKTAIPKAQYGRSISEKAANRKVAKGKGVISKPMGFDNTDSKGVFVKYGKQGKADVKAGKPFVSMSDSKPARQIRKRGGSVKK